MHNIKIIIICLLSLMITGCDPVDAVRRMREADRQKQQENNIRQMKEALKNYETRSSKSDSPSGEPSQP
jgi:hypothetical protein